MKKKNLKNNLKYRANLKMNKNETSLNLNDIKNILNPITSTKYTISNQFCEYGYLKKYKDELFHDLTIGLTPITIKIEYLRLLEEQILLLYKNVI